MNESTGKKINVVVGMSGGVDSSVTALILKKIGCNVIGVFMQNWDDYLNGNYNDDKECSVWKDYDDALKIAQSLDIPLYKVDFIREYWDDVFSKSINLFKKGETPNPDILCNKYIKFKAFFDYCFKNFKNIDYIATGHYANVDCINGLYYLKTSKDKNKDQTYFLSELSQIQLSKTLFPLGNIDKSELRWIANYFNLITWNKKDSTGICFIGEQDFEKFLFNYIEKKEGNIVDIISNKIIGKHNGVYFYTIGQRKNLNIFNNQNKYFVCRKDLDNNILYVVEDQYKTNYLTSKFCSVTNFNWISFIPENKFVKIKFRHSPKYYEGYFELNNNKVNLFYMSGAQAVTIGQYAVLYQNDICLGGGKISFVKTIL